jgi:hypothetical protein
MRNRIWNNLANIKFKSLYTAKISRRAYHCGNAYSIFLAFASASSVAAWAIWAKYPLVWALIVSVSQVFHIAKPYIPFLKCDREFTEMSLLHGALCLSYEKLWYDCNKEKFDQEKIEKDFYIFRERELEIDKRFKHVVCPIFNGLMKRSDEEANNFLRTNF